MEPRVYLLLSNDVLFEAVFSTTLENSLFDRSRNRNAIAESVNSLVSGAKYVR